MNYLEVIVSIALVISVTSVLVTGLFSFLYAETKELKQVKKQLQNEIQDLGLLLDKKYQNAVVYIQNTNNELRNEFKDKLSKTNKGRK